MGFINLKSPKILAPAGDKNCFLAAIAAGADAIYCGLKIFSARMEAANFSIEELARLTRLAASKDIDVYLTFNSIIKESELEKVFNILCKLVKYVDLQALIIQDPALVHLAQKAGFNKAFHLSTLGNCTSALSVQTAAKSGFSHIVLPRELNIDEIKEITASLPDDIQLEAFVHGALCYSVSGRCYWSSWFGGKSSLRGRCVQPCRRIYEQKGQKKRHFSCLDFSADVLVKVLKDIPGLTTWKIEGRKKSPHYVYYTVKAYKLFRDHPEQKKQALSYLDYAMGRGFTHFNLLSQRLLNPLDHESDTGSGLFAGRIKNPAQPYFVTREALMPADLLRIGYEEDTFHDVQRVTRAVPKKGNYYLKKSKRRIKKGTPVYLIDRRDELLTQDLKILEQELEHYEKIKVQPVEKSRNSSPVARESSKGCQPKKKCFNQEKSRIIVREMDVFRKAGNRAEKNCLKGVWLSAQRYAVPYEKRDWLWVDPLLFPKEEKLCRNALGRAIKKGVKNFVLNTPWQISLFSDPEKFNIWAGPFCNITNSVTIHCLKQMGFSGAIVSPELDKETLTALPGQSALPLGAVIYGNWPLGISRILSPDLKTGQPLTSPKKETAWVSKFNSNYHVFPNWLFDLTPKKEELSQAGFELFIRIHETVPRSVTMKKRPGLWNWNLKLI